MKIPVFQLINLGIILVALAFLVRYAWEIFFGKGYFPVEWEDAMKSGRISRKLRTLEKNYPDKVRFFNWWFQIERLKKESIPGGFAELGVYKGESAAILHHMDPERIIHLFDTFTGFPPRDLVQETGEAATYTPDRFSDTQIPEVLKKISGNRNLFLHPGYFPDTAEPVGNEFFSLVNLDADLYQPTRAALEFFYPRLSPGGVIFIHDYNYKWEGIKKAVDEFSGKIPECPVLVPDMDGTCMIIKNKKF
ncbi:MAG: class I SAM-dependent methyltransferase [Bacteroidetes bacterium]|nr:class I SAM-dependent methyltransferase [Bacteroidota bacterium]